jgi:hypothetical protein
MLERCSFSVPFVAKCHRQNTPFAKHIPNCVRGIVCITFRRNLYTFRENIGDGSSRRSKRKRAEFAEAAEGQSKKMVFIVEEYCV